MSAQNCWIVVPISILIGTEWFLVQHRQHRGQRRKTYTRGAVTSVSEWARSHAPILEVCLMRTNYEINCENLALLMPRLFARQVYNFDRCIISHTRVYRHKVYDVTTLQQLYLKHGGSNYCWQNNVTVAPLYIRGAVTPLTSQIVITRRHVSDILNPGGNYIF